MPSARGMMRRARGLMSRAYSLAGVSRDPWRRTRTPKKRQPPTIIHYHVPAADPRRLEQAGETPQQKGPTGPKIWEYDEEGKPTRKWDQRRRAWTGGE
jgi:hypothetical protein